MTRGPAPTPTAILKQRGSKRAIYDRKGEPELDPVEPDCPSFVPEKAREYWAPLAAVLYEMKVMTEADKVALGLLCESLEKFAYAREQCDGQSAVAYSEKGGAYMSPWYNIYSVERKNILTILAKFGMTPSDRARVRAVEEAGKDKTGGGLAAVFAMIDGE